jgi:glyoxylase-like metal-dependent hydrolase (beta-lactamase superfamily II)
MLVVKEHGAIRELVFSTRLTRSLGYKVSAFLYRGILVDTGFPRVGRDLDRFLDGESIAGAIVTHWHEDHSGNVARLARRSLPVTMSPETWAMLPRATRLAPYRWAVWGPAPPLERQPAPVEHPFELIPTPGHAVDHLVVWDPEAGVAFLGDLFLGVKASVMHHDEDPRALVASLRLVLALQPRTAFCAHRGRLGDPVALLSAKTAWLEAAIGAVEAGIERGESDEAITRRVLGAEGLMPYGSGGELRKRHFVAAVRRGLPGASPRGS